MDQQGTTFGQQAAMTLVLATATGFGLALGTYLANTGIRELEIAFGIGKRGTVTRIK